MSVFLQPIYTQTVGSGGVATVTFNSIPQTFTDLMLQSSVRTAASSAIGFYNLTFNGITTASYSLTTCYGNGSAAFSNRSSSQTSLFAAIASGSTTTSNTFGSSTNYISNYASSNYKSIIIDSVSENNLISAGATEQLLEAGLFSNTAAITSISIVADSSFVQYSNFTLYGVLRAGI